MIPLLMCALGAAGCDSPPGVPDEPPEPELPARPLPSEPRQEAPPPTAWPEQIDPLDQSLGQLGEGAECVAKLRERIPVELAEALADIGYVRVVDDVCAGIAAERARSGEACDALSVSAVQRGCRRRVALLAANPDLCPRDALGSGRDPVCLAWARRDASLCRAANGTDRPRCEAVLSGDADRCDAIPLEDQRAVCRAEIARYHASLGEERTASDAPLRAASALTYVVERGDERSDPLPIAIDLERGVHLAAEQCVYRVVFGSAERIATRTVRPDGDPECAFQAVIARSNAPLTAPIDAASARIVVPAEGTAQGSAIGSIRVTAIAYERGAPFAADVQLTMPLVGATAVVSGTLRTFVRDLDPLGPECAAAPN